MRVAVGIVVFAVIVVVLIVVVYAAVVNVIVIDIVVLRCFATYQILLAWKTCKHYYETDELPNPRPTQPKKNEVKSGIWATFSHSK